MHLPTAHNLEPLTAIRLELPHTHESQIHSDEIEQNQSLLTEDPNLLWEVGAFPAATSWQRQYDGSLTSLL